MPDPSNSSFIPKRGPAARTKRKVASKQVYIFALISYVVMFATLLAAGGVFLYQKYLEKNLNTEITALNSEIASFSKERMNMVLEFNARLEQASDRVANSVSLGSIFSALEAATIESVVLNDLTMERVGDEKYLLSASVITDSFDSTIFQRGVVERNPVTISSITILDLQAAVGEVPENEAAPAQGGLNQVTFTAEFEVPVSSIPAVPAASPADSVPLFIQSPVIDTADPAAEGASLLDFDNTPTP